MSEHTITFADHVLTEFAGSLLEAVGVPASKAALVASSLVAANLRGVDTHGVQLLAFYLERLERGEINARAEGRVVSESGGCLVYDGENGLGQVISNICCEHAGRLAKQQGVACVAVRESNHFGCAAFWARKISEAGCIGIVMCNASAIVPPWQGREGKVGTNPICMSIPGDGGRPWLLDMATTTVAAGKIFKAFHGRASQHSRRMGHGFRGGPHDGYAGRLRGTAHAARRLQGIRTGADGGDPVRRPERRQHEH